VVDDEGTQGPVEAGSRDLRSWGRRSSGVLTPYAVALDAFVAAEANMKRGRSVAEGFVGETADDGIANDPVATMYFLRKLQLGVKYYECYGNATFTTRIVVVILFSLVFSAAANFIFHSP
jgi:hypothetical protein